MRRGVEAQPLHFNHLLHRHRRNAPHHGFNSRHQLFRGKRLSDVVIGAGLQAADAIFLFAAGGQHHHRNIAGHRFTLELFNKLQTRPARQHPVKEDQIRPGFIELIDRAVKIFRLDGLKAVLLQNKANHFADWSFIFNDQNSSRHYLPCIF